MTRNAATAGVPGYRIAYITTRADAMGGVQVHIRDLGSLLRDQGHQVIVYTGNEGAFTEELTRAGIEWKSVPGLARAIRPWSDALVALRLRRLLAGWRPDLVSTHSSKAGILGRAAAWSLRIPVLFTAHGWAFTEGVSPRAAALYRTIERLFAPLAERIISVSEYDRRLAVQHRVGRNEQLLTVHNGVKDIAGVPQARPELDPPVITMVARFEEQKDHALLVEAMAGLVDLPWTLRFVGGGPLEDAVKRRAAELGLMERIEFLGARSDVPALLASSQIFALITKWEGFPRSILEAMRAGLPVLATDVAGCGESVRHDVTGCLVARGDIAGVQQQMRRLLESPELRQRLGGEGRRSFERDFTLDVLGRRMVSLYSQILSRAPAPRP